MKIISDLRKREPRSFFAPCKRKWKEFLQKEGSAWLSLLLGIGVAMFLVTTCSCTTRKHTQSIEVIQTDSTKEVQQSSHEKEITHEVKKEQSEEITTGQENIIKLIEEQIYSPPDSLGNQHVVITRKTTQVKDSQTNKFLVTKAVALSEKETEKADTLQMSAQYSTQQKREEEQDVIIEPPNISGSLRLLLLLVIILVLWKLFR